MEHVLPGADHQLIDFVSESDPWPGPPAIDGTAASVFSENMEDTWVVRYDGEGPLDDYPHWITFGVGEPREISGLEWSVKSPNQGHIGQYEVYVSSDPAVVDTPATTRCGVSPSTPGNSLNGAQPVR